MPAQNFSLSVVSSKMSNDHLCHNQIFKITLPDCKEMHQKQPALGHQ